MPRYKRLHGCDIGALENEFRAPEDMGRLMVVKRQQNYIFANRTLWTDICRPGTLKEFKRVDMYSRIRIIVYFCP